MTFDEAAAFALTLPDTAWTTSHGERAVGVAAKKPVRPRKTG